MSEHDPTMPVGEALRRGGAVDVDECPDGGRRGCPCGRCAVCGFAKHAAVHGPFLGEPPGSEPYGHEFKALASGPGRG